MPVAIGDADNMNKKINIDHFSKDSNLEDCFVITI
jgi:hypothetical protein